MAIASTFRKKLAYFLLLSLGGIICFHVWAQAPKYLYQETPLSNFSKDVGLIVQAAHNQVGKTILYDPAYTGLKYPNGDVPLYKGVCTDVVVRSLRVASIDLQKEIHQDMKKNFNLYPANWGLKGPDPNIDHGRVPNQQVYFSRKGWSLKITKDQNKYKPGDIVAWKLNNGRDHVGIVSNKTTFAGRPLIVHNIGMGAQLEDVLFDWKIIGHYRVGVK